jgi:hypothetical protein
MSLVGLVLLVSANADKVQSRQKTETRPHIHCGTEVGSVIRFFYKIRIENPNDLRDFPLFFQAVADGDKRINTLGSEVSWRVYLSSTEMQQLVQRLDNLGLTWQDFASAKPPIRFETPPAPHEMQVFVFCKDGSARGEVPNKKVCQALEPLDSIFQNYRDAGAFQSYREGFGCHIPRSKRQVFKE